MNSPKIVVSLSFDDFTDHLLDRAVKHTGLSRSELVRRLILEYAAGSNYDLLPEYLDKSAVKAAKAMVE